MKKLFRRLHLWLSVPFGVVMTLICFSGAALVFEPEVTKVLRPDLYYAKPVESQPAPPQKSSVAQGKEGHATQVKGKKKKKRPRMDFFQTMFRLHRWLLHSGTPDGGIRWGKLVVGVSTLMMLFAIVSGLVIWWPRTKKMLKSSLKINVRKGWARFNYQLHVAGGMYAVIFLLVMVLTGLTWSFSWYRTGFYGMLGTFVPASELRGLVYSLHVGDWGGLPTRILYFGAALLGGTLPLTGYYLWWRRLKCKKQRA